MAGLTALMNPQNLRPGVDLDAAEQAIMGRSGDPLPKKSSEVDPIQLYTKELNALADELGIDFLDNDAVDNSDDDTPAVRAPIVRAPAPPAPSSSGRPRNPLKGNAIDDLIGDLDLGSDSDDDESDEDESDDDLEDSDEYGDDSDEDSDADSDGDSEDDSEEDFEDSEFSADSIISNLGKDLGIDLDRARRESKRRNRVRGSAAVLPDRKSRLGNLTEEQERRRHINSVMGDMRQETRTSFGVEYERVQDVKASKLEQVGQLRMTLVDEGIDCSGVGEPTMASPIDEIESVLSILKLKNDRNRYSSLAEEVILGFAEGIETVFDGTREVPIVGWTPDYTNYHNTINVKLHRMRFETSQVVGNVIEKYNIGPTTRIIMELLPSFFLYPRQQKKQKGSPGLSADFGGSQKQVSQVGDARKAYASIRGSDTANTIADI